MNKRQIEQLFREVPGLAKAWDEYGFDANRADIVDAKAVIIPGTHLYAAFYVKFPHGMDVVDFAGHDLGHWEVQNDSHSPALTHAQFKRLSIPEGCDCLEGWPDD